MQHGSEPYMKYLAYIRFIGNETEARLIYEKSNLTDLVFKQYKRIKAEYSPTGQNAPWGIKTSYFDVTADIDKGLQKLLIDYKKLISIINKYKSLDSNVYVVVVMQYDEDEDVRGIYLSHDTLSLLSESKFDFETDIVSILD